VFFIVVVPFFHFCLHFSSVLLCATHCNMGFIWSIMAHNRDFIWSVMAAMRIVVRALHKKLSQVCSGRCCENNVSTSPTINSDNKQSIICIKHTALLLFIQNYINIFPTTDHSFWLIVLFLQCLFLGVILFALPFIALNPFQSQKWFFNLYAFLHTKCPVGPKF
jgi:hypothetical protein